MCLDCPEGYTSDIGSQFCEPYDVDLDGVPDEQDNCPTTPNPAQVDTDGDGEYDTEYSGQETRDLLKEKPQSLFNYK